MFDRVSGIMARRPLSKIKDIDDSNSLWRVGVLIKDSWMVTHGKSIKKHLELVVCDDLVISFMFLVFFLSKRRLLFYFMVFIYIHIHCKFSK
jgi:hypothetical protein